MTSFSNHKLTSGLGCLSYLGTLLRSGLFRKKLMSLFLGKVLIQGTTVVQNASENWKCVTFNLKMAHQHLSAFPPHLDVKSLIFVGPLCTTIGSVLGKDLVTGHAVSAHTYPIGK